MSLPLPSKKLNTLMQCLPDAPFKTHMAEEIKAYGQSCREQALEEAHTQCLYVSDATSEGHSALASPSSAAEDCADRITAMRNFK